MFLTLTLSVAWLTYLSFLILEKENKLMAIGQEILQAVTEAKTGVDNLIALMQGLVDNGTIDAETASAIISTVSAQKDAVNAAMAANQKPVPPVPPVV